jgi:phospho-N-acetylmuramoyl-pentapeptide-transferase
MQNYILTLLIPAVTTFVVALLCLPPLIKLLHKRNYGQRIRIDGPDAHKNKAGTPTMGGIAIVIAVMAGVIIAIFRNPSITIPALLLSGIFITHAVIGSLDDWKKINLGRSLGLKAREKLILQVIFSAAFLLGIQFLMNGLNTDIAIFGITLHLGWFYWVFAILFITAFSNAANLTDGLDGLAAGTTAFSSLAPIFIAVTAIYSPSNEASAIILGCLVAACLAFLIFNCNPASVFMGDTGSLAIGALVAGAAIILKIEALMVIICLVFMVEMFSVIIQVISFKTTGKRVFKMSPYHHHLELCEWKETAIVTRAWILSIFIAIIIIGFLAK